LRPPFYHVSSDTVVVGMVLGGVKIKRPAAGDCRGCALSDEMWSLMERCWASPASIRPPVAHICASLHTNATVIRTLMPASGATPVLEAMPFHRLLGRALPLFPMNPFFDPVWITSPKTRVLNNLSTPSWLTSPKILVVDDDPVTLRLCCKMLHMLKCFTSISEDGESAMRQMNVQKYDLVLMVRDGYLHIWRR
jgi:CheY-like chemotaxis protein